MLNVVLHFVMVMLQIKIRTYSTVNANLLVLNYHTTGCSLLSNLLNMSSILNLVILKCDSVLSRIPLKHGW